MKISSILTALSVLSLASAAPSKATWGSKCLSRSVGAEIVSQFSSLLTAFDAQVASNLLSASNFTEYSDSINYLAGVPQGSVTFPSQAAFIGGAGAQPSIDFELLAIDSVSCDGVITFRWQAGVATHAIFVKGINVLYTSLVSGGDVNSVGTNGWQINMVFSEFNSAAWVVDIGGTCAVPSRL